MRPCGTNSQKEFFGSGSPETQKIVHKFLREVLGSGSCTMMMQEFLGSHLQGNARVPRRSLCGYNQQGSCARQRCRHGPPRKQPADLTALLHPEPAADKYLTAFMAAASKSWVSLRSLSRRCSSAAPCSRVWTHHAVSECHTRARRHYSSLFLAVFQKIRQSARGRTSIARDASSRARSPPDCDEDDEVCNRRPSADEIVSPRPDAVLSQKIASWLCSIARCTQGTRGVRPREAGSGERRTGTTGGPRGSSRRGGVP